MCPRPSARTGAVPSLLAQDSQRPSNSCHILFALQNGLIVMVMAPSFVIKQDLHHLNRGCTRPVSCLPAKIVEKPDALHRVGEAYLSNAPSQPSWNRVFDFFHIQVMWPQVSLADAHRHTAATTVSGRRCSLSICLRSHLDVLRAQLERQPVRPLHSDLLFSWGWQESWQKKGE